MSFDKLKTPRTAEGLRVDTERRFFPRFKNPGLAPSNVSKKERSGSHRLSGRKKKEAMANSHGIEIKSC
jgi:hypothetical protein